MQYLSNWTTIIAKGGKSVDLAQRPLPVAMLYDNTTVQGSWIDIKNMKTLSKDFSTADYDRVVINVSMAMPYSGVFSAARDPINKIMQPQDLNVSIVFPKNRYDC